MTWYLFELRWIGAPPLPNVLRVANRIIKQDPDAPDLTPEGCLDAWRHPRMTVADVVREVGEYHPCKARWVALSEPWEDGSARLAAVPWTEPKDVGPVDAAGRVRGHPGGGKAYGRPKTLHTQPRMRGKR